MSMRHWIAAGACACLVVLGLAGPAGAQLRSQVVVQGLSAPILMVPDPTNPSRFFIAQQGGLIRVFENGALLPDPLLDLSTQIRVGGEEGLLGLAFAPDAATSGRMYVTFNSPDGDIVLARFRRSPATALTVDPGTRFDFVWPGGTPYIPHPTYSNHNGGNLVFGPDGYLYLGLGDGGSGNDPDNHAQSGDTLLGKMVRIDVNVPDGHATGYVVPPTNPFVGQAALEEIWDVGLRNPWRYSFDDVGPGATGALIIGDVGQGAREEVNYEPAGAGGRNYGWRIREGSIPTPGVPPTTPAFLPLVDPLFDYPRDVGRAVTGGYVYRGSALPAAYRGRYFVADFVTSRVGSIGLSIDPGTGEARVTDVVDHTAELAGGGTLGGVASFARDAQGELYLLTFAGRLVKIVADSQVGTPGTLSGGVAGRTVSFQWSAPPAGAAPTGYRLEAGSGSGLSDIAVLQTGTQTALTVTSVPDGEYFVRVRAERSGAAGDPSNELRIVVTESCTAPPAAPSGLTQSVAGSTVFLSWSGAPTASGYVVEAGSATGLSNLAVLSVGASTSLSVVAPTGFYFVRVRGLNPCGAGGPSNEVLVSVP
ncbi:MAG: PQQ-dependent sugar dehydrogenase [Vicinamibacterales bacterium]